MSAILEQPGRRASSRRLRVAEAIRPGPAERVHPVPAHLRALLAFVNALRAFRPYLPDRRSDVDTAVCDAARSFRHGSAESRAARSE